MSNFEHEIATGLTSDAITAEALTALVERAQVAIAEAESTVRRESERALDPQLCSDPQAAKNAMENALLTSGRCRTLLTRLQRKRSAVEAEERLHAWEADFKKLKAERNALADELVTVYPELTAKLIDLFTRITVFDGKLNALFSSRPSSAKAHLTGVELEARQLETFSRDRPPILKEIRLFDLASGKQSWPPIVRRDLSATIPIIDDIRHSSGADWWKYADARAAEQKAETDRLAKYYERQKAEREEREEREKAEHAVAK